MPSLADTFVEDQPAPSGQSLASTFVEDAPKPAPDRGFLDAAARTLGNGASVGMGPQFSALVETGISKLPWVRELAAKTGVADPSVVNPNISYSDRLANYTRGLDQAREQHPVVSTIGETVGGLATAPIA